MLLESLKALINAGRDALETTCGLPVRAESVSQVSRGSLTFPAMADVSVPGSGLQCVHVGCDSLLCGHLARLTGAHGYRSGQEALARCFLDRLVEEVPGRHPRGRVVNLAVEPLTVRTRGIRTFGFRFETAGGQLFLLAEVPSRVEWENECGGEYLQVMTDSFLPAGWAGCDHLAEAATLESFLVFLRKTELDVELQLPAAERSEGAHAAFLIESCLYGDEPALKFALAAARDPRSGLLLGTEVAARVGLAERSLEFRLRYLAGATRRLSGDAELDCALFSVPDAIAVAQRRRSFRIPLAAEIVAKVAPSVSTRGGQGRGAEWAVTGLIADLSFSGARIAIDGAQPETGLAVGDRVGCRFHLPGRTSPVEVRAIVRRAVTTLNEGAWPSEELGLEFVASPARDAEALDAIRDFVLGEQRTWLARRIQVAGVDNW